MFPPISSPPPISCELSSPIIEQRTLRNKRLMENCSFWTSVLLDMQMVHWLDRFTESPHTLICTCTRIAIITWPPKRNVIIMLLERAWRIMDNNHWEEKAHISMMCSGRMVSSSWKSTGFFLCLIRKLRGCRRSRLNQLGV